MFLLTPRQSQGGNWVGVSGASQEVMEGVTTGGTMWICVLCGSNRVCGPQVLRKTGWVGQYHEELKEFIL